MAGVYSLFQYIYPGPHMDKYGRFDDRIWFVLPVSVDEEDGAITYLKFPFGGDDDEITEESGFPWIA